MEPHALRQLKAILQARLERVVRSPLSPRLLALLVELREAEARQKQKQAKKEALKQQKDVDP